MAHSYKFAILRAIPDELRNERVNIGIAIFGADTIDVRFSELQKLKALTGQDWESYAQSYRVRAVQAAKLHKDDNARLAALAAFERVITPSDFGWLQANNPEEFEARIKDILNTLVVRSLSDRKKREPRINTEIAAEFRRHKILARSADELFSHKVVRNLEFEKHRGLRADFVLKNGVYHVTATLDLRKTNVRLDEACLKAVVLDKANDEFSGDKRLFGVYATPLDEVATYRDHIDLLGDYADEVYNWMDRDQRIKYEHRMYDALNRTFGEH